jgi:hypothetical protein
VIGDVYDDIKIGFEVQNVGSSDATIIASAFEAHTISFSYDENPPPIVGDPPQNFLGPRLLKVNAVWREFPFAGQVPHTKWRPDHFHETGDPKTGFFWGGKILYQDELGNTRRLGVYRRLDIETRRFRELSEPDTDYEYDD